MAFFNFKTTFRDLDTITRDWLNGIAGAFNGMTGGAGVGFRSRVTNGLASLLVGISGAGHTSGPAANVPFLPEHDHYVAIAADTHYYGPPCLIPLPDSRVLCLYRKGTTNGSDNGQAAAKWSSDLGATWGAESVFSSFNSVLVGATNPDVQSFDAVLLPAGTALPGGGTVAQDTLIGVFFIFDRSNANFVYCYSTTSLDYGASWSAPARMPLGSYAWAATGGPPILMPDGSILSPQYGELGSVHTPQQEAVFYCKSTDGGATWSNPTTIAAYSATRMAEPNLLYIADGSAHGKILCLIRNLSETPVANGSHIMACSSADAGATWTAPANAFHGSGAPRLCLTTSGTVIASCRNTSVPNTSGSAALEPVVRSSSDYGVTWATDAQQAFADSDTSKPFAGAYASVVEILPGVVAWAYTKAVDQTQSVEACDLRLKYLFEKAGPFSAIGSAALMSLAVTGRISVQGDAASLMLRDGLTNLGARPPAPAGCALLQMDSTTRGALLPRLTTTQRNAISSPVAGLVLHNTTTGHFEYYDGSAWRTVADLTGAYVSSFNSRTGAVTLSSSDVTTALTFTPLAPANNLSELASAATARTNLGLGSVATHALSDLLQAANALSELAGSAATARGNIGAAPLASPTFTGTVTLPGDPAGALQAVPERYQLQGRGLSSWLNEAATTAALNQPAGPNSRHWIDLVNDSNYNEQAGLTRLQDGRLFLVYRKGTTRSSDRGVIYYRTSSNLGATWSAETILVAQDATYDWQYPNVMQTTAGTIYVSYYDSHTINLGWFIKSTNNGVSWSAPTQIPTTGAGATLTSYVLPIGPMVQLANGNLGLVYYTVLNGGADTKDSTVFVSSSDGGATWSAPVVIANGQTDTRNYDTPYLLGCSNGDLLCFINDSTTHLIRVYKSTSPSYGAAWSAVGTWNGQGPPNACQLADGTVVCAYRERTANSGYGTAMMVRISTDEGTNWSADANEKAIDVTNSALSFFEAALYPVAPGLIACAYSIQNSSSDSDLRLRYLAQGAAVTPDGAVVARSLYIEEGEAVVHGGALRTTQFGVQESKADASACVQSDDTAHGWLPPRQTTTQRTAISSPGAGLWVTDTTLGAPHFYNGNATAWQSFQRRGVVALTDAATIATDASKGDQFSVTLGGNRTLGAPTNPTDGQVITYAITQDGTGSRTLAYNAAFSFGTTVTSPTLSTGIGKIDYLTFRYNGAAGKWHCVNVVLGY